MGASNGGGEYDCQCGACPAGACNGAGCSAATGGCGNGAAAAPCGSANCALAAGQQQQMAHSAGCAGSPLCGGGGNVHLAGAGVFPQTMNGGEIDGSSGGGGYNNFAPNYVPSPCGGAGNVANISGRKKRSLLFLRKQIKNSVERADNGNEKKLTNEIFTSIVFLFPFGYNRQ